MENEKLILKMLGELAESQAETNKNINLLAQSHLEMKESINDFGKRMDSLENRLTKIEVNQETVIIPQIKLLAEGHGAIIDHIKRLDSYPIQEMQEDIALLKTTVKALLAEVAELRAAR